MREVTITRRKDSYGCLSSVLFYISDPVSGNTTAGGEPCRLLGKVKNGGRETFSIPDSSVRIYAVIGKGNRNGLFARAEIGAGTQPVQLSGHNDIHTETFCFDGIPVSEDLLEGRKKFREKRTLKFIAVFFAVILLMVGLRTLADSEEDTRQITYQAGDLSITMDAGYQEETGEDLTSFQKGTITVVVENTPFSVMDGLEDLTEQEFFRILQTGIAGLRNLSAGTDLCCGHYTEENAAGALMHRLIVVYKGPEGFYIVSFVTPDSQWENRQERFLQWAGTIQIQEK